MGATLQLNRRRQRELIQGEPEVESLTSAGSAISGILMPRSWTSSRLFDEQVIEIKGERFRAQQGSGKLGDVAFENQAPHRFVAPIDVHVIDEPFAGFTMDFGS